MKAERLNCQNLPSVIETTDNAGMLNRGHTGIIRPIRDGLSTAIHSLKDTYNLVKTEARLAVDTTFALGIVAQLMILDSKGSFAGAWFNDKPDNSDTPSLGSIIDYVSRRDLEFLSNVNPNRHYSFKSDDPAFRSVSTAMNRAGIDPKHYDAARDQILSSAGGRHLSSKGDYGFMSGGSNISKISPEVARKIIQVNNIMSRPLREKTAEKFGLVTDNRGYAIDPSSTRSKANPGITVSRQHDNANRPSKTNSGDSGKIGGKLSPERKREYESVRNGWYLTKGGRDRALKVRGFTVETNGSIVDSSQRRSSSPSPRKSDYERNRPSDWGPYDKGSI